MAGFKIKLSCFRYFKTLCVHLQLDTQETVLEKKSHCFQGYHIQISDL